MKKSELVKILKKSGCILVREGSNHEIWRNPITGAEDIVSRSKKEVPTFVASRTIKKLTK